MSVAGCSRRRGEPGQPREHVGASTATLMYLISLI